MKNILLFSCATILLAGGFYGGFRWLSHKSNPSQPPPQGSITIRTDMKDEFIEALDELEKAERILTMSQPLISQIAQSSLRRGGIVDQDFSKWRLDRDCLCLVPAPTPNPATQLKPEVPQP